MFMLHYIPCWCCIILIIMSHVNVALYPYVPCWCCIISICPLLMLLHYIHISRVDVLYPYVPCWCCIISICPVLMSYIHMSPADVVALHPYIPCWCIISMCPMLMLHYIHNVCPLLMLMLRDTTRKYRVLGASDRNHEDNWKFMWHSIGSLSKRMWAVIFHTNILVIIMHTDKHQMHKLELPQCMGDRKCVWRAGGGGGAGPDKSFLRS